MSGLLYLAELSRHSWPPRDRTAQYLRIRQAPSTSWVVAIRERRAENSNPTPRRALVSSEAQAPPGSPSVALLGFEPRSHRVWTCWLCQLA